MLTIYKHQPLGLFENSLTIHSQPPKHPWKGSFAECGIEGFFKGIIHVQRLVLQLKSYEKNCRKAITKSSFDHCFI
jgi:hypothetical protein